MKSFAFTVVLALLRVLVGLFGVATLSFFVMDLAPGSPESGEKRLSPAVEALALSSFGLADTVVSPCSGEVTWVYGQSGFVHSGDNLLEVRDGCKVLAPTRGDILYFGPKIGDRIARSEVVSAIRPARHIRYFRFIWNLARGNLGVTFSSGGKQSVADCLAQGFKVSMVVGVFAFIVAITFGIPLGLFFAFGGDGKYRTGLFLSCLILATPSIVLAPLLQFVFAEKLRWFSLAGLDSPKDIVLPATALGMVAGAPILRITMSSVADFLRGPVTRALVARGISRARILLVHALRHAMVALLGILPPIAAGLLAGSLIVEKVFNLPGIARDLVASAMNRDYPLVIGVVLVYSAMLLTLSFLANVALAFVDPRMRHR